MCPFFQTNAGNCFALVPKELLESVLKMQSVGFRRLSR